MSEGASRRQWLEQLGSGFGSIALAGLLAEESRASERAASSAAGPLAVKPAHFPAKAKRCVFFFENGGPSHVDLFDPKPALERFRGKALPESIAGKRSYGPILPSPFRFTRHGQSGIEMSELFPHLARHADSLCVLRSMWSEAIDHAPAAQLLNTGHSRELRAAMGSWILYGLGSENQNLPGFIALCPWGFPVGGQTNWQSAFLPANLRGVYIDPSIAGRPLLPNLANPVWSPADQRRQMKLLAELNEEHRSSRRRDELEARIHSFELAFHMQSEAPAAFDLGQEPAATRDRYGRTTHGDQALLARRLLERGVRFVQVYHGFDKPWDTHDQSAEKHRRLATESDRPIAALLDDLKQRDMLRDTLVIWGGEFGRTPTAPGPMANDEAFRSAGRDHNWDGFTMWMAGGGSRGGVVVGATDDFGRAAVERRTHVHDVQATILHLLGLDHRRLTYHHSGRDFRLTDTGGNVIKEALA